MERPILLEPEPGRDALALCLERGDEPRDALRVLGLELERPVLVAISGAAGTEEDDLIEPRPPSAK